MFSKVRVALGEGYLDRYTILEIKWLFSIYFHVFNTVKQDRFHTHAFHSWAWVLCGDYEEEYIVAGHLAKRKRINPGLRYIPRDYNHRLLTSKPNTLSIVFAGPWAKTWTEENSSFVRTLTWGRREINRQTK